jgi:heterodisulfide reductase subunit D
MNAIHEAIKRSKAYYCLECGKCTAVCPVSLLNEGFNPRLLIKKALMGNEEQLLKDEFLWSCLTCRMCNERCESDVNFAEFIRDIRIEAYRNGQEGTCSHGGIFQSIMRMMTSENMKQNRLDWISKDLKISSKGEVVYFVGCLPYFDSFFTELNLNTLSIAISTIKILNCLGIEPILMENERCCGHDLLWTGDIENFTKLAEHNIKEIEKTGANKLITSCAEGYWTLKEEYPRYVGKLGVKVIHISEFIKENIPELKFNEIRKKVTYQDPCRLGRFSGIYEEPREVIEAVSGLELREMNKNRKNAICCGTSGWINCTNYSKQIQVNRLKEAKSTEAELLITSCPKCQIHFKCTRSDENIGKEINIDIKDLTTVIADALIS